MHFSTRAILSTVLAASSVVVGQTTHNVLVGETGLTFTPNQVTASIGDVVSFEFHPKNHTLTQSTFATPCTAMPGGVDSGFMPVSANATSFPVYSFKVNEVTPLWFYCAQTGHCAQGMVFAVNVNASSPNTFAAYQAKATGGAASTGSSVTASGSGAAATGMVTQTVPSAASTGSAAASSNTAKPNAAGRLATGGAASLALSVVGIAAGLLL